MHSDISFSRKVLRSSLERGTAPRRRRRLAWIGVLVTLAAAFAGGGGSNPAIASLLVLRPLSALLFAIALASLTGEQIKASANLLALVAATLGLVAAQLVPLPPAIWHGLPGRELIVANDRLVGLAGQWRPLSLDPAATWNTLFSLLLPAAALLFAIQLRAVDLLKTVDLVLVGTLASALLGLLQILGDPEGPLYFYAMTNNGAAVGLFANRNHQALLLAAALPMLAFWAAASGRHGDARPGHGDPGNAARRKHARRWIAIGAAMFLAPLLLVTGSRAGLLLGVMSIISVPLVLSLHRSDRAAASKERTMVRALSFGAFALLGLILASAVLLDRDEALNRLLYSTDPAAELRVAILPVLKEMVERYFPWGTGFGTFEAVYLIHEPDALLGPAYVNHAHNDWIELLITGGLPGAVLIAWMGAAVAIQVTRVARGRDSDSAGGGLAILGCVILAYVALGSLGDYPLRVPIIQCVFALALVWVLGPVSRRAIPVVQD